MILVVFVVNANLVPNEAGEDAGPAAGASDGACVVRLGAAAAVVASNVTNSNIYAIGAAEAYTRLYKAQQLCHKRYCIGRLLRGPASESLDSSAASRIQDAKRCSGLRNRNPIFKWHFVMSPLRW